MGENTAPIQSADLSGIIERLEKATGPDRFINTDIAVLFVMTPNKSLWAEDYTRCGIVPEIANFTGSVDAALALADRVLPDAGLLIGKSQTPQTRPWARVGIWSAPDATGPNLAIAICLATFRALQSKGEA